MWNPLATEKFFNIYNVDSGEKIGSFCNKGRGNMEFVSTGFVYQLFKKDGDLMTLLNNIHRKEVYVWNISESINKQTAVYDTIVPHDNNLFLWQFYQHTGSTFEYKISIKKDEYNTSTPYYEKYNLFTNELEKSYPLYNVDSVQINSSMVPLLYSSDAIKSDGSKIAEAMRYFPQINILDTQTGELTGYRTEKNPTFSFIDSNTKALEVFYTHVYADDNYIYANYIGEEPIYDPEAPHSNRIHIFDWNGNMVYELITDLRYSNLWVDPVRNRLYTISGSTKEIYFLDLNECLQ
ncbi:MAG: hypothetical protein R3Y04_01685 [Rikenellaceae bacterium]